MRRSHHLVLPVTLATLGCLGGISFADNNRNASAPPAVEVFNETVDASMKDAMAAEDRFQAQRARLQAMHKIAKHDHNVARLRKIETEMVKLYKQRQATRSKLRKERGAAWQDHFDAMMKRRAAHRAEAAKRRQAARSDARETRQENRSDRQEHRQDARSDRQDHRQDARNDRQGHRQDARNDRQDQRSARRDAIKTNRSDHRDAHAAKRRENRKK